MAEIPKVFLSATWSDLREHRAKAKDAILDAGAYPVTMEHFGAEPLPPVEACLAKVDEADAVVVVVGHRCGWQPGGRGSKSITRLECERARAANKPIFAFLVDPAHPWPVEHSDNALLIAAAGAGDQRAERMAEALDAIDQLKDFKKWLDGIVTRAQFTTPDSLRSGVLQAISQWNKKPVHDASAYTKWLREYTGWIDLRGLKVGSERAHRFEIEKLYVTLTALDPREGQGEEPGKKRGKAEKEAPGAERKAVPLERILRETKLVIQGDAGAGKTTFLRRLAREACAPESEATWPVQGFPLFVRISELDQYIAAHEKSATAPDAPCWIPRHLAARGRDLSAWDLPERFFEDKLKSGGALLLLDGLDEAASEARRENIARLFEKATAAWPKARFVVTTRPGAYVGKATLDGFAAAKIEELDDASVDRFLEAWSNCLYPDSATSASLHRNELRAALDAKPEIRRMARNPVMLTALAVVHWNDSRLPEQRAELYESVLGWLAVQRPREGRVSGAECLRLFGHLALRMQEGGEAESGVLTQVGRTSAAQLIAPQFRGMAADEAWETALAFVTAEEVDSGIVTSAGGQIRFWHRTFQEHLAARAIAGLPDPFARLAGGRPYLTEWREVMLLLGGVLERDRLDLLFAQLTEGPAKGTLAEQARCYGLVGAMLRDLGPVGYALAGQAAEQYGRMSRAVLGLFEPGGAKGIPLKVRVEAAEALGAAGDPRLRLPKDKDYWVSIPAGRFWMGAQAKDPKGRNFDKEAYDDETVSEQTVQAFRIGKYPVSVWEWSHYVEAGGGVKPKGWDEQLPHPSRPVVNVNWHEAKAYCDWAKVRLMTEVEWEYAARGAESRRYAWGNEDPTEERANIAGWVGAPSPVGLFPDGNTAEGVSDMTGNVWEWTSSLYNRADERLVYRGGSCYDDARIARCAYRYGWNPVNRIDGLGFRCAAPGPG